MGSEGAAYWDSELNKTRRKGISLKARPSKGLEKEIVFADSW